MQIDKQVISELIKRQMAILGPGITLTKVRSVQGVHVDSNGEVVSLDGPPQVILTDLINQFVELSGLIVKETMESILASGGNSKTEVVEQPQIPSVPPAPSDEERQALSSQKEIEELNKMLNQGIAAIK